MTILPLVTNNPLLSPTKPDPNVIPTESFLRHPHPTQQQISATDTLSELVETFGWDILDDDREEAQDLLVVLTKFEIVGLSRKNRKKGLRKKEKGENFGGEVGFRVYDVKKNGRRWRRRANLFERNIVNVTWLFKLDRRVLMFNRGTWGGQVVIKKSLEYQSKKLK